MKTRMGRRMMKINRMRMRKKKVVLVMKIKRGRGAMRVS